MTGEDLQARFEIVAHTADFGIRGQAPTLTGLFEVMARGLFALIAEPVDGAEVSESGEGVEGTGSPERVERRVRVSGESEAALLWAWLREINGLHHEHGEIYDSFAVTVDGDTLDGRVRGEVIRPDHGIQHEIKGITWHDLQVSCVPGGYTAHVVLDV